MLRSVNKLIIGVTRRSFSTKSKIGIIGVPFYKGQRNVGVKDAPQAIRNMGLIKKLTLLGYNVTDHGDLEFEELENDTPLCNVRYPRTIGKATKKISEAVSKVIKNGEIALSIGGDHAMSLGTVYGHKIVDEGMVVVWIDAHADINTPLSSESGNLHGMPLSFMIKELVEYMPKIEGFEWVKPILSAKDICYIGLRDVDPAERYIIEKLGITCYTIHEIDKHGLSYVLEKAIEEVNPGLKRSMHMSYDIDALDPVVSPSTGTAVPGGLTIREGMFIAEELAQTGKLNGIDLVEVNPQIGTTRDQDLTLFTATEVLCACFGKRRTGNISSGYNLPRPSIL